MKDLPLFHGQRPIPERDGFELLPKDLQGWNDKHTIFEALINHTLPKVIIEVGTWKGASAINMAKIVKKNEIPAVIYCVDTWLGAIEFITTLKDTPERYLMLKHGYPQIYYQFLSNIIHEGVEDVIIPIPNTSTNAARYFKHFGIKADLIYIDGSHEYEDVRADIIDYSYLLTGNGVMFGDDYGWAGVNRAVNELLKVNIVDQNYWVAYKNQL